MPKIIIFLDALFDKLYRSYEYTWAEFENVNSVLQETILEEFT